MHNYSSIPNLYEKSTLEQGIIWSQSWQRQPGQPTSFRKIVLPNGSRRHRSRSLPLTFSALSQHCCFTLYGKLLGLVLGEILSKPNSLVMISPSSTETDGRGDSLVQLEPESGPGRLTGRLLFGEEISSCFFYCLLSCFHVFLFSAHMAGSS